MNIKCKKCKGTVNQSRSKNLCDRCLETKRQYYLSHKDVYIKSAQKKKELISLCPSLGICVTCLKRPSEKGRKRCSACLEKKRLRDKAAYSRKTAMDKVEKNRKQRARRAKNIERYRENGRKYYRSRPEKYKEATRRRNAVKKGAEGNFTNTEWLSVLGKYEGKCLCCGSTEKISRDHVVPLSRGGSNRLSNIQPLCEFCNKKKSTKIIDFRPFGNIILDWT